MQGVCTQRHFPAVAQPFRILWAPWPLAVLGFAISFVFSGLIMALVSASLGGFIFPFMIIIMHGVAIAMGFKLKYFATMVFSLENRRTGTNNLGAEGNYNFDNI